MMKLTLALAAAAIGVTALAEPAMAQNEQFLPALVYRTGPYAPNGIPFADGVADYWTLLNERDGGINGVKIVSEECETGYATDKGVECYERLKGKGPTGAGYFSPLSTGITFALTEKVPGDKIPLLTMGYGRSESRNGAVFPWNFIAVGTYWTAADVAIQHIAKELGGIDKLKGKKISLVYHDSPYGKEPILALEKRAEMNGFTFKAIPVTHPGVEQKSQWLSIRQDRPDYVLLWGWGVMNSTAIKEAAAVGYPRDKMIGVWWSGAEPDVTPAGDQSIGYKALMLQHGAGKFKVHEDLQKFVLVQGQVGRQGRLRAGALQPRPAQLHDRHRGDPHRAGEVRQQADDRRAGALGLREPQSHGRAHQGARLRGHAQADEVLLPGPPGRRRGPRPAVGRQAVEGDLRQLQGRSLDPRPDGQGRRRPSTPPTRRSRRATAPRRADRGLTRIPGGGVSRRPFSF